MRRKLCDSQLDMQGFVISLSKLFSNIVAKYNFPLLSLNITSYIRLTTNYITKYNKMMQKFKSIESSAMMFTINPFYLATTSWLYEKHGACLIRNTNSLPVASTWVHLPPVFDVIRVAHLFSFLCFVKFCLIFY